MANLPVPSPRTFQVNEIETAAYLNSQRDGLSFLLNPPDFLINQTAAQTFTTGVSAMVQFNATQIDTYGGHSNSTNNTRYTAQVPGTYFLKGNPVWVSNGTGGRTGSLFKNGVQVPYSFVVFPAASTNYAAMGVECCSIVTLAVGDYIELSAAQDSGGNLNSYVAGAQSNLQGWFMHA